MVIDLRASAQTWPTITFTHISDQSKSYDQYCGEMFSAYSERRGKTPAGVWMYHPYKEQRVGNHDPVYPGELRNPSVGNVLVEIYTKRSKQPYNHLEKEFQAEGPVGRRSTAGTSLGIG